MNDLSVLFPLVDSAEGYLRADTVGRDGPFLPATAWAASGGDEIPGPQGGMRPLKYSDLRVVALRLDPCFAQTEMITEDSPCENQLRLTLQPLAGEVGPGGNNGVSASDAGVHLFYSLDRAEFLAAVRRMIAARVASAGDEALGALAPHPLMVRQGVGGAYGTAIADLLKTYARSSRLVRIARFNATDPNAALTWVFRGVEFKNGVSSPMNIPKLRVGLGENATQVAVNTGFGGSSDLDGSFSLASSAVDSLDLLISGARMRAASSEQRQAAFDAAMRIENPSRHSPDTIDCATCHMGDFLSESAEANYGVVRAGNANVYVPDARYVAARDMNAHAPLVGAQGGGVANLHMFSYFGRIPGVSNRVVNETAAVLAYVNGALLK